MRGVQRFFSLLFLAFIHCQKVFSFPSDANGQGVLPSPPNCGIAIGKEPDNKDLIAPKGAYPWVVLLGYEGKQDAELTWNCQGTLISNQYVLSTAHCLKHPGLKAVRLGDQAFYNNGPAPQDIQVEATIVHLNYQSLQGRKVANDIGLIRLKQPAVLNDYVSPVCLPTNEQLTQDVLPETNLPVAGYSRKDSTSQIELLHILVKTVEKDICQENYSGKLELNFDEMMCVIGEEERHLCRGTSGMPLMKMGKDSRFYQIGFASLGPSQCGTLPSVYTKLSAHLSWILSVIRA